MSITKKQNKKINNRRKSRKRQPKKKQKGGNFVTSKLQLRQMLYMIKFASDLIANKSIFIIILHNIKHYYIIKKTTDLQIVQPLLLKILSEKGQQNVDLIEIEDYTKNILYDEEIYNLNQENYTCLSGCDESVI